MSALGLCALKQRSWLEDLGPVGRQSFPAVTDAASRSSCSATCSVTAGTVAQMSKTARHVSTAQANTSNVTAMLSESDAIPHFGQNVLLFMLIRARPCLQRAVCFIKDGDASLAFAHERSPAGVSDAQADV